MQTTEKAIATARFHKMASSFLMTLAIFMALGFLVAAIWNPSFYQNLIAEDGVVEANSSFFWFLAALGMAHWSWKNRAARGVLPVALVLLGAFVACGGEEISWGQRIFGFATPDALGAVNKQNETNLHNIGSISVFSNVFFLASALFFLLPLVPKFRACWQVLQWVHPDATRIFLVGLGVWMVIGLRFGTLGFSPLSLWGHYTQMDDEIYEFFAAFAFCAFAWLAPVPTLEKASHKGEQA